MEQRELLEFIEQVRSQFQSNDKISLHLKGHAFKVKIPKSTFNTQLLPILFDEKILILKSQNIEIEDLGDSFILTVPPILPYEIIIEYGAGNR